MSGLDQMRVSSSGHKVEWRSPLNTLTASKLGAGQTQIVSLIAHNFGLGRAGVSPLSAEDVVYQGINTKAEVFGTLLQRV